MIVSGVNCLYCIACLIAFSMGAFVSVNFGYMSLSKSANAVKSLCVILGSTGRPLKRIQSPLEKRLSVR